jgi:hypothetical protein
MANVFPTIGLAKLDALRGRERLCHLAWGVAKWLTLLVGLLAVSTFIDWRIDKDRETPMWVRVPLTLLQFAGLAYAFYVWVWRAWFGAPSIIHLALRVEDRVPEFGHRLVTSIQLNDTAAQTKGMSPELIANLTRESESLAGNSDFLKFAETVKLKRAGYLSAAPVVVLVGLIAFYGAALFGVLVQRQFLARVDVPRFNSVENATATLWPAGDEVVVRYEVTGKIRDDDTGRLRVKPDDLPADEYALTFEERVSDDKCIFLAKIPPSSVNFSHRAWIGDGRSRQAAEVIFEPRPVVTRVDGWVRMPAFLGSKTDGAPYEEYQAQGELTGLASATARIRIAVQKPLGEATITTITRTADGIGERDKATFGMKLLGESTTVDGDEESQAEGIIEFAPDVIGYRIEVRDRNRFANATPPRRGIQILPDDPPVVRLLPERYGESGSTASDEDIIEGLPVPIGGQIPIAYVCRSVQGVGKARLMYRVNEKGNWTPLPLREVEATDKTGPFDPARGTFAKADDFLQVEMHPSPSKDRDSLPDFLSGGGRFDFQIAEITKNDPETGRISKLEIGDRVEFYVEVYDRNPSAGRKPGRSETRMKEVLSAADVLQRLDQTRQAESKIRDLEKKQRDVFGKKKE